MKTRWRPLRGESARGPAAFLQGSAAFACGVPYENNPHKEDPASRERWGLGWKRRSEGVPDFLQDRIKGGNE